MYRGNGSDMHCRTRSCHEQKNTESPSANDQLDKADQACGLLMGRGSHPPAILVKLPGELPANHQTVGSPTCNGWVVESEEDDSCLLWFAGIEMLQRYAQRYNLYNLR